MAKFTVYRDCTEEIDVEADNEEEAIRRSQEIDASQWKLTVNDYSAFPLSGHGSDEG